MCDLVIRAEGAARSTKYRLTAGFVNAVLGDHDIAHEHSRDGTAAYRSTISTLRHTPWLAEAQATFLHDSPDDARGAASVGDAAFKPASFDLAARAERVLKLARLLLPARKVGWNR